VCADALDVIIQNPPDSSAKYLSISYVFWLGGLQITGNRLFWKDSDEISKLDS
jgi:hypothetical protein